MACPFFYPVTRLNNEGWVIPPRLPLGDAYLGECHAGGSAFQPDETHVRQLCNTGYERGACSHFPQGATSDAVRFHIAEDAGALIRVQYVLEKDCWPVGNGMVECTTAAREIRGCENAILRAQAAAFVESYLRRKAQSLVSGA